MRERQLVHQTRIYGVLLVQTCMNAKYINDHPYSFDR